LDGVRSSVSTGRGGECTLSLFDLFEAALRGL
jgi:hypothetical protein